MFTVTDQPIVIDTIIKNVQGDDKGAVVVFLGQVRNHSEAGEVIGMEYEAYGKMAEEKLEAIGKDIHDRWDIACSIAHRIGKLDVGEVSVVIAVSAPHRKDAFEACRYAIERIKEVVPIWKKEILKDGTCWVEGKTPKDQVKK